MLRPAQVAVLATALAASAACGGAARLPISAGVGPNPALPPPRTSILPLVNVVTATGWNGAAAPVATPGTVVRAFATGLQHPRWLYVLPNGDVLVAETNAPARPDDNKGFKGWFFKRYQKKAGGAAPSANRITLLRDTDGDGVADTRTTFLENLNAPFGMALVEGMFYVANADAIVGVPYTEGATTISTPVRKLTDLPGGTLNHHWTKSLIASGDGSKLYAGVGSNSNVAENGIAREEGRAAIWEIDRKSGTQRILASGLRNPVGMAWETVNGSLWVAVNERDELGSDLVPDYITAVRDGAFYGWPYSYYGSNSDKRVKPQRPDLVARAVVPDYALGPHTASLGLAYAARSLWAERPGPGMFVGQHGSWNRKPRSGYKVIFVPFVDGHPAGEPVDVLTGFVDEHGNASGRPVGVAIDAHGALLVADDVGNTVWRVTGASGARDR